MEILLKQFSPDAVLDAWRKFAVVSGKRFIAALVEVSAAPN
jgi:hypothetical protein